MQVLKFQAKNSSQEIKMLLEFDLTGRRFLS